VQQVQLKLFPKNEEWGTGDESQDLQLTKALKLAASHLSLESISDFYFLGINLRPRAYNPGLSQTIELVTKGLLFHFSPDDFNDVLLKKIKGRYFLRQRVEIKWEQASSVFLEIKKYQKHRYNEQLDFSLIPQVSSEFNPYISTPLKKSPYDLQVKIVFKDFKAYLNDEDFKGDYDFDSFLQVLRLKEQVHCIENFGEIWFDGDQIRGFCSLY
jgi:hypothetical protein